MAHNNDNGARQAGGTDGAADSKLPANILNFVRLLRGAGLRLGPACVIDAVNAVAMVGVANRDDFYWALHAVLVRRHDQHAIFDQAFRLFWRAGLTEPVAGDGGSEPGVTPEADVEQVSRRLAEALQAATSQDADRDEDQREIDAAMTWSAARMLGQKDFEQMSREEIEAARRVIARLQLAVPEVATRRYRPLATGPRIDIRRTLAKAVRHGGDIIPLAWRVKRRKQLPLVALCDISGSMSRYSRMLLHFLHSLAAARGGTHVFLFGTELTNITRLLAKRDVDDALADVGAGVVDWSGGTRIGAALHAFNRYWSRRVLAQGATVLLITDGLDREGAEGVEREMERLRRSCRRLIWLNPLLRFDGYAPLALGARAIAPHVDEVRTVHNLDSLEQLAAALSDRPAARRPFLEEAA